MRLWITKDNKSILLKWFHLQNKHIKLLELNFNIPFVIYHNIYTTFHASIFFPYDIQVEHYLRKARHFLALTYFKMCLCNCSFLFQSHIPLKIRNSKCLFCMNIMLYRRRSRRRWRWCKFELPIPVYTQDSLFQSHSRIFENASTQVPNLMS